MVPERWLTRKTFLEVCVRKSSGGSNRSRKRVVAVSGKSGEGSYFVVAVVDPPERTRSDSLRARSRATSMYLVSAAS
jgi:hypothetical protein